MTFEVHIDPLEPGTEFGYTLGITLKDGCYEHRKGGDAFYLCRQDGGWLRLNYGEGEQPFSIHEAEALNNVREGDWIRKFSPVMEKEFRERISGKLEETADDAEELQAPDITGGLPPTFFSCKHFKGMDIGILRGFQAGLKMLSRKAGNNPAS